MKINDFLIIGLFPILDLYGSVVEYVILGDHETRDESVTARIMTLEDTSWAWGNYFHGPTDRRRRDALCDAAERANMPGHTS